MVSKNIFEKFNINITDYQLEQFNKFYVETIEKNKVLNLTTITNEYEFFLKHYIDSLIPAKNLSGKILDVGTGGGFPGIPLSIFNEKLNITLLDSLKKRLVFLDKIIEMLCLHNICTVHARCEDFANTVSRETYDFVLSRAVAKLNTLSEYCLPFVKLNGYFIAYKSGEIDEELEKAKKAIEVLGGKIDKIEKYNLENNSRTLIYIKKIKNTPKCYPRKQNKPRLMPL